MLRCVFCGYCVDACPEEAIIMSNNYDMAYFNRDQSIATKEDLQRPYTYDESRLGYRPSYPEEEAQRSALQAGIVNLVEEARQSREIAVGNAGNS
jgi:NADH-quinone oxidoreductase subunit I